MRDFAFHSSGGRFLGTPMTYKEFFKYFIRIFYQKVETLLILKITRGKKYVLSYYGVKLRLRKKDLTFDYAINGHYGDFLWDICRSIDRNVVFLDVGANLGLYSLIAATNPNVHSIYAFEPDPVSFEFLKDNVAESRSPKIYLQNYAIGEKNETKSLTQTLGHSGGATFLPSKWRFNTSSRIVHVLNESALNELIPNCEKAIFIKIDVEGSELQVLNALAKTNFFNRIEYFVIEFDLKYETTKELTRFLRKNGFVEFRRSGSENHWDALWTKNLSR
jgi:FkbM family methyltransferase